MFKLKTKSVIQLQHERKINPENAEYITGLILAKLLRERKIRPFKQELDAAKDDVHKNKVLKIFSVASSFMDKQELLKLDSKDDQLIKLKGACSLLRRITIKDGLVAQGDDDYEKRGQVSKIL